MDLWIHISDGNGKLLKTIIIDEDRHHRFEEMGVIQKALEREFGESVRYANLDDRQSKEYKRELRARWIVKECFPGGELFGVFWYVVVCFAAILLFN
jgi:hypothetical protein